MKNRHSGFDISCNEQVLYRAGKSIYPRILLVGYTFAALGMMLFPFFSDDNPGMSIFVVLPLCILLFVGIMTAYAQKDNEVQITDRGVYWHVEREWFYST